MEVWLVILITALAVTVFILLTSFLALLLITGAARSHSRKAIRKVREDLKKELPGTDCGECGCSGCSEYAECVFTGSLPCDRCVPGGEPVRENLEKRMASFLESMKDNTPKEDRRSGR